MEIIPFTPDHIACSMRLKDAAGWNQTTDDWRLLLELTRHGSYVAVLDGTVIGTVTLAEYEQASGGRIGWVGMVLVDPSFRRRGIATALLTKMLSAVTHLDCIGLDATSEGLPVYERLGFRPVSSITRWERSAVVSAAASVSDPAILTPIPREYVAACAEFDMGSSGFSRVRLLESFYRRAPEFSTVVMNGDAPSGFLVGRRGSRAVQLGPVNADSPDTFSLLLDSALQSISGTTYIDMRDGSDACCDVLAARGFRPTRGFSRMALRADGAEVRNVITETPALIAIAGPEFG